MDIAIIGMGGKFPHANNLEDFYLNLSNGIDSVREFSYSRISNSSNPFVEYLRYAYLENIDRFDHAFFGLSLSEAEKMDPNQRLLLQIAYEIFEDAGLKTSKLVGSRTSVYVADKQNYYHKLFSEIDSLGIIGNLKSAMAGRISRFFDLRGTSLTVDSACSSSLVAINLACQELSLGVCDQALVCASEVNVTPLENSFKGLGVISKSFKCKTFSAEADGIGLGEMVGGVLLKRLDDAIKDGNTILAIVKGIAVNQDAALSSSLTAPNSISQEDVITTAWRNAKIDPAHITYIEAHGTGTTLGDPIEIKALNSAFSKATAKQNFCAISSVKTNIGHTDGAAGMAALIKVILSLENKVLFPSLHFKAPNPFIDFAHSPLYVNTQFSIWNPANDIPRTAGISCFSIMGTNTHMVVQEYVKNEHPKQTQVAPSKKKEKFYVITFSAKSQKGLSLYASKLKYFLERNPALPISDISYSLLTKKESYKYHFSTIVNEKNQLRTLLGSLPNVDVTTVIDKLIIIAAFNRFIDQEMIDAYSERYPFFLALNTEISKSVPTQSKNDKRVVNFIFQFCLIKLLEYQGITTKHYLQDNFGRNICHALKNEISFGDAFENILSMSDADLTFDDKKLDNFRGHIKNQASLIIDISGGSLGNALLKAKDQNDRYDLSFLNESSSEESLYNFYLKLYKKNVALKWENILLYPCESCRIPTYAFEPNRCWINDRSTMGLHSYLYQCSWINSDLPIDETSTASEKWLVFGAQPNILNGFSQQPNKKLEVINVQTGSAFEQIDQFTYSVDFNSMDSFDQLFDLLNFSGFDSITGILYCAYTNPSLNKVPIGDLLRYQFNILSALTHLVAKPRLQYFVLTQEAFPVNGKEKDINRFQQSVAHGFIGSAGEEYTWLRMKGIDIDETTIPHLPRIIHLESCNNPLTVAYRDGNRFVKCITPSKVENDLGDLKLEFNGVYVITGGPNGIGLEVAKWLSSLEAIKVVFIGRKEIPELEKWDQIANSHSDFKTIQSLREIHSMGSEVTYFSSDVSDKSKLIDVFSQIRRDVGPIKGIVHSAGIPGDSILASHSWITFYEALLPKVNGLMNLAEITEIDNLSFFINFSSLDSIIGSPGNTNYGAANAFLDSYTHILQERGINAKVINWPAWKDTGMWNRALQQHAGVEKVYPYALSNWEGISILNEIIRRKGVQFIVSKESPGKYANQWFTFESPINHPILKDDTLYLEPAIENVSENNVITPVWMSIEDKVAALWMDILKTSDLSLEDDFFDLGGHSLHAASLFNKIESDLGVRLNFEDLLEYSTVKSLSALIATLLDKPQIKEIETSDKLKVYPASSAQKRMWVLCQDNQVSKAYNELDIYEWSGNLNIDSFKKVIDNLLQRHEVLRITFKVIEDQVVQQVVPNTSPHIEFIDYANDPEVELKITYLIDLSVNFVFDLENGPLCNFKVIKKAERKFIMIFNFHHTICDGYSQLVFISEFKKLYEAIDNGRLLPLHENRFSYIDYSTSQQLSLSQNKFVNEQRYWSQQLAKWDSSTSLHGDLGKIGNCTAADTITVRLGDFISDQIAHCGKKYNVTPFIVFYAGLSVFFSRYLNEKTTVFGTVTQGRQDGKTADQIGLYVNTLPLLNDVELHESFREVLLKSRGIVGDAIKNQSYPFEKILEDLRQYRQISIQSLFRILILFEDTDGEDITIDESITVKKVPLPIRFTKFDLTLTFIKKGQDIDLQAIWNKASYNKDTIDSFVRNFQSLLQNLLSNNEKKVFDHIMIDQVDRELLNRFNDTSFELPYKGLVEMLRDQSYNNGDASAVVLNGQSMTFSELWHRAGKVKDFLLSQTTIMGNPVIPIMMDRSNEMIVCIWGILRAGLAYMPVDPLEPKERLEFLLCDSNARLILTDRPNQWNTEIFWTNVIEEWETINKCEQRDDALRSADSLTYVIYTSGSTGQPKGVMVEDAGVVNRIEWMWRHYNFCKGEPIMQKTPFTFDVSVWEIFMTLCYGGKLILCPRETIYDPILLSKLIQDQQVTTLHFVPSMYNVFLSALNKDALSWLKSLRHVMVSGETLKTSTVKSHYLKLNVPLQNLYGPTEASVDVTYFETGPQNEAIPIGKPISNIQIQILDDQMNLLPIEAIGNIWISGIGLARGYLNRPELTSNSFIQIPDGSMRMYRTGDLGRWRSDGNIEFIGRNDGQVKVRGNRIELGEVENILMRHENIREAVALVEEGANQELELIAFYSGIKAEDEKLRTWLKDRAPQFMIPNYFFFKQTMPFTSSGKIDKKALKAGIKNTQTLKENNNSLLEINKTERAILQIWKQVLGEKSIRLSDNFFLLGGDSIKVIRVCNIVHKQLDFRISFQQFLDNPTISELASFVERADSSHDDQSFTTTLQPNYNLSPGQKRLWILDKIESDKRGYIISSQYDVEGLINFVALEKAFNDIIKKYEILRTRFDLIDGEPRQTIISHNNSFKLRVLDLEENAPPDNALKDAEKMTQEPFDLSSNQLMKVLLVRAANEKFRLIIVLHHIVCDAWSINILTKDLINFYNRFLINDIQKVEVPRVQYKDYSEWLFKKIETGCFNPERDFWLSRLSGDLPVVKLPNDFPRSADRTYNGGKRTLRLEEKVVHELVKISYRASTTLFVSLLSAVNTFLNRYSGQEDIIVGVPVANRDIFDAEEQIGFFVNTLPVRVTIDGNDSFLGNLKTVKQSFLEAYENQHFPFNDIVDLVKTKRDRGRNPIFDIMVSIEENNLGSLNGMEGLEIFKRDDQYPIAKFDLSFEFIKNGPESVTIDIVYSTDLFKESTIERLIANVDCWFKNITTHANEPISTLGCVSDTEVMKLKSFNSWYESNPEQLLLVELFEKNVACLKHKNAVFCDGRKLSFIELNEASNRIANFLRDRQTKPNDIIGVMMMPSEKFIVTIFGILKSGAAYLPLDHDYPFERVEYCLKNSGASMLIVEEDGQKIQDLTIPTYTYLELKSQSFDFPRDNPTVINSPSDLAYVMYTSGSTGRPKGVLIKHSSIAKYIQDSAFMLGMREDDKVIQQSSISFDASVEEIFSPLCAGASLLILPYGGKDIEGMLKLINAEKATIILPTPLVLNELNKEYLKLPSVRMLASGGDRLLPSNINNLIGVKELINVYGPTEATVAVTFKKIETFEDLKTVGKPLAGDRIIILDLNMEYVPIGVEGYIFIGGDCLAKGYCGTNDEGFVDDPYHPGQYLFETGDLGKWTENGEIIFIGRNDNQRKIRGHRVEIEEVEKIINTFPKFKEVITGVYNIKGEDLLLSFIVGLDQSDESELRFYLQQFLPYYMIPNRFVFLKKFPMTANGKIDYTELEKLSVLTDKVSTQTLPGNEFERYVYVMWIEVLSTDGFGINDNFFDVGGNSIKLLKLFRLINDQFPNALSVSQLFTYATVSGQARLISKIDHAANEQSSPTEIEF